MDLPIDHSSSDSLGRSIARIDLLLDLDRNSDAIALCKKALATWPGTWGLLALLARAQIQAGLLGDSLVTLERAIEADPLQPWAHAIRARVLLDLRRVKEALAASKRAVALDPEDPDALAARVYALARKKRHAEANRVAEALIRCAPGAALTHQTLGMLAMAQKRWADAESWLRKVLHDDPSDVGALVRLARVLKKLGRHPESAEVMQRAVESDPQDRELRRRYKDLVGEIDEGGLMLSGLVMTVLIAGWVLGWWASPELIVTTCGVVLIFLWHFVDWVRRRSFRLSARSTRFLDRVEREEVREWWPGYVLVASVLLVGLTTALGWDVILHYGAHGPSAWWTLVGLGAVTGGMLYLGRFALDRLERWHRSAFVSAIAWVVVTVLLICTNAELPSAPRLALYLVPWALLACASLVLLVRLVSRIMLGVRARD